MNPTATDFLTRCFAPGDTIALLLRRNRRLRRPISVGSPTKTTAAQTSMSPPIRFALAADAAPKRASRKSAIYI
jgi:hypothetical protein